MGCSENCGPPCLHVLSVVNLVNLVPQAYSPLAKGKLAKDPLCSKIGEAHGKSAVQVRSGKLFSEQIWTRPVVSTRYALCLVWCKTTSDPSFNYCAMLNFLVGGSEHEFYFSIHWECHHPNWRTALFFRGVGLNHQPVLIAVSWGWGGCFLLTPELPDVRPSVDDPPIWSTNGVLLRRHWIEHLNLLPEIPIPSGYD